MPKISVVVPAYNIERYLDRCLSSLHNQTLGDWDAIVVDDCSIDSTGSIADSWSHEDPRIVVVHKPVNQGLHLARRTGMERVNGDYVLLLDGDDELAPGMLSDLASFVAEHDADIVHYGISVCGENGVTSDAAQSFADYINKPTQTVEGDAILSAIYDEAQGQLVDWRATQRLYRSSLAKRAFEQMTAERLERAEDGYEVFVLSDLAQTAAGFESCRGYIYHYGIGVTGASAVSAEKFGLFCSQFSACIEATRSYAEEGERPVLQTCFTGLKHKMFELLANDWQSRVDDAEKQEALMLFMESLTPAVAAREMYRFVRDALYSDYAQGETEPSEKSIMLIAYAESALEEASVRNSSADDIARLKDMRQKARVHLDDLKRNQLKQIAADDVRIFVTTHKNVSMPRSDILQAVQVGPGNESAQTRFPWAFHDDEGDNISWLNPMYCEMTTQYWAWKNTDSNYVGFCHYRRYFSFAAETFAENPYGEVMDDFIDARAVERYGLNDESILRCIKGYDIVTTGRKDLRLFPEPYSTPHEQYAAAPLLHIEDLDRCMAIVKKLYPDYAQDVDEFMNGNFACFCNMYILRRDLFDAYCSFVFPVLDEFMKQTNMYRYSKEALRTPGHLTERLFNIWLIHCKKQHPELKTKELQCVHFEHPEPVQTIEPAYRSVAATRKETVPVVFAADDGYVAQLTCAVSSMLENASHDRFYDVYVLQHGITADHQRTIKSFLSKFENARVTFFDVSRLVKGYRLDTNNDHISQETYYRFLVQDILRGYDKVLYLDSDLVVNGDVAQLYDTDLSDNLVAATHDVDYLGNLNINDGIRMRYSVDVLGMEDPYRYFQAGVLVLNTAAMRELHTMEEWLQICTNPELIYNDQDVLNVECEGRVEYLDSSWNVTNDIFTRVERIYTLAPHDDYDAYLASRKHPKIVHFAGAIKPWADPRIDMAGFFWKYARETPFYETLLQKIDRADGPVGEFSDNVPAPVVHEKAVSEESPLRKIVDPIAPFGTQRREVLKAIGRAVRGKQ